MNLKLQIILVLGITLNVINLQAQDWQWAKTAGGSGNDSYGGSVTDANGNTYVAGSYFSSNVTFPKVPTSILLDNIGTTSNADMMLAKYDEAGDVQWAVRAGGSGSEQVTGIALDASGNIFVTGVYSSASINIGTGLTNSGGDDIFIFKYDPSGNVLWAKSAGSTGDEQCHAIAVDASGNCYITGAFNSPDITFGSTTLTRVGGNDVYVAKYDGSGNVSWAVSAGGTSPDVGKNIAIDANGDIFIVGDFYSPSIQFGTTTALSSTGVYDIFIVKYNSSGVAQWAQQAGSTANDLAYGIALDASSNCYVSGSFAGSPMVFGGTVSDIANVGSGASKDLFLAKYNSSGTPQWATRAGGTGDEVAVAVMVDQSDSVYITGTFNSNQITFGSSALINAASPSTDIFITKFDALGNVLWAKSIGGPQNDQAVELTKDANGFGYLSGNFASSSIVFPSANTITGSGTNSNPNVFLAQFDLGSPAPPVAAIKGKLEEGKVSIYPNPFSESATISFGKDLNNATAIIMNATGKEVKRINFSGDQMEIKKNELHSGIYFIQILMDGEVMVAKKLIVE